MIKPFLFNSFSKSRKDNGQAQNRRPDLSYGARYSSKIKNSPLGEFLMNIKLQYRELHRLDGIKNSKQKSVDLIDLSFSKNIWKFKIF